MTEQPNCRVTRRLRFIQRIDDDAGVLEHDYAEKRLALWFAKDHACLGDVPKHVNFGKSEIVFPRRSIGELVNALAPAGELD